MPQLPCVRRTRGHPANGRLRGDSGTTAELVLLAPLFFGMVFALVEIGLWMYSINVAKAAAEEAATVLRAQDGTPHAAEARGEDFLAATSPNIWATSPTVEVGYISDGQEVRAVVTGSVDGPLHLGMFNIVEVSQGPVEEFRAPGEEQAP